MIIGEQKMNRKLTSVSEYEAITNTVANYIEALRTGNIDILADSFHKDSVAYGTVGGKLVGGSSNPTIDFIKKYGKAPDLNVHIDVLDVTPSSAVVRIIAEKDAIGADSVEYQLLMKIAEGWTIVAKAFHEFEK